MFEKEAQYYAFVEVKHKKEWYIQHPERSIDEDYEDIKKHWGKGAEFGYNKAMKDLECLKDCSNCKHWQYSTRSLSYYCDKTNRIDDCERQYYRCEHWEY